MSATEDPKPATWSEKLAELLASRDQAANPAGRSQGDLSDVALSIEDLTDALPPGLTPDNVDDDDEDLLEDEDLDLYVDAHGGTALRGWQQRSKPPRSWSW